MPDFADQLITELDASSEWPPRREQWVRARVIERRALRRGDKTVLKGLAGWDRFTVDGVERDYLCDGLPRRVAVAFADFLFGEDPAFVAADDSAQDDLETVVKENRLAASLHRACRLSVSEGEVWWKLHVNRDIAPVALVEWRSRLSVVPLFYGDRLLACAFVSEKGRKAGTGEDDPDIVYRHCEVHCDGRVTNVLYEGTVQHLGRRVPLDQRPETVAIAEDWRHGLPMLAGRVVNDFDDDDALGESDYTQVVDQFLALNEAVTIAAENARLTAKDRVYVAGRLTRADGSFDTSIDVIQVETDGPSTLGEGEGKPPIVAVEKTFDAEPLIAHMRQLVETILTRVGLVVQVVGQGVDGHAETGAAIRLRFMPTINAANGKAREWDSAVPRILDLMLRIGALPVDQGGFSRSYTPDMGVLPTFERTDALPTDESEDVRLHVSAVAAEIESRETAIRALHPDWSDEQIADELGRIRGDAGQQDFPPSPGGDA